MIEAVKLEPWLIGNVVTVQLFERKETSSDSIIPDSLIKMVGRLECYAIHEKKNVVKLKLVGDKMTEIRLNDLVMEIYWRH